MKNFISQRLKQYAEFKGFKQSDFIIATKIPQGNVSSIFSGKRSISKKQLDTISKCYPDLNIEWLMLGNGEMLKFESSGKKYELSVASFLKECSFFNQNFSLLIQYFDESVEGLSAAIGIETQHINLLLEGQSVPDLSLLIALRRRWDLAIDNLLYADFSQPDAMESLQKDLELRQQVRRNQTRLDALEAEAKTRKEKEAEQAALLEALRKRVEGENVNEKG